MKTLKENTYFILGGYLMNDNEVNVEYLAHLVSVTADNTESLYRERFNTRRKPFNLAICELKYFIDTELKYSGFEGYYCTNKQLMQFDADHNGSLTKVVEAVAEAITCTRQARRSGSNPLPSF